MLTGGIGRGRPTLLAQGFATYGSDYGIVGLEEYDPALYKQLSNRPTAAK